MAITELETLKDINFYKELGKFTSNDKIKELLKSKVINWIKHWLKVLGNPKFLIDEKHCVGFRKEDMDRFNMTECEACASIGAFVNFFNFTEEDLMTNDELNAREHGEVGNN